MANPEGTVSLTQNFPALKAWLQDYADRQDVAMNESSCRDREYGNEHLRALPVEVTKGE